MSRHAKIPQKSPVFLGCEGDSEQAYGQVLNALLHENERQFFIQVVNLNPGAGDPLAMLRRAGKELERLGKSRAEYRLKFMLIDSDRVDREPERRRQAEEKAWKLDVSIVWQEPCHEAFLLRHIDGLSHKRPTTTAEAITTLRSRWPEYRKPMTRMQLAKRIDLDSLKRAAAVEPSLSSMLRCLRLLG
ncbi:MAG TPA: RloB domain-containing protein [Methylocystis sp.]|nr:RloB domain-containing protein [Methylocystis sp.]